MENLIPILIIGAIYFYNVYKKFKEEQVKHQQRQVNKPSAAPAPTGGVPQPRTKSPASPPPITYTDQKVEVLDPWTGFVQKEKKRTTSIQQANAVQEVQKINKNLPKINLEVVELEDTEEEINALESSFDLQDAIIKSAILHRPKV